MKSLIFAAMLSLTPTASHIPLQKITVPDQNELNAVSSICIQLFSGKVTAQEVVDNLHLDTAAKQQDLVDDCSIYLQGVKDGIDAARSAQQKEIPTT